MRGTSTRSCLDLLQHRIQDGGVSGQRRRDGGQATEESNRPLEQGDDLVAVEEPTEFRLEGSREQ